MEDKYCKIRNFQRRKQRNEHGSALIPVLALIVACSLLVTAIIAMSQLGAYTMNAHTAAQKSMYVCEGAMNRIQWLLAAERNKNPNANIQNFDYSDYSHDRFLPDGVEHEMDYHGTPVRFRITDAAAGLDFSQRYRYNLFRQMISGAGDDSEIREQFRIMQAQVNDYVDSDDVIQEDGLEESEFQEQNKLPLPRNGEIQYREELFYLPGFTALYPPDKNGRLTSIRLIPPMTNGRQQNLFSRNPSIFGVDELYLKYVCKLDDSEIAQVQEAIRLYQQERIPFDESLESTLMPKLRNITWNAGRTCTVTIENAAPEGTPARRLAATHTIQTQITGPSDGAVRYYEWMFF